MKTKKTLGKRKIPMKKIEKTSNLLVTFSKRRAGLFKKAGELSVLCGAEIAILVQSPAAKVFAFGSPSVESVLRRFRNEDALEANYGEAQIRAREKESRNRYAEIERKLEGEKEKERRRKEIGVGELWWEKSIEGMGEEEVEEYAAAMGGLRENVVRRLEEMEKMRMAAAGTASFWGIAAGTTTSRCLGSPAECSTVTRQIPPEISDMNFEPNRAENGIVGWPDTTSSAHCTGITANTTSHCFASLDNPCSTSASEIPLDLFDLDFEFGDLEWTLSALEPQQNCIENGIVSSPHTTSHCPQVIPNTTSAWFEYSK